MVGSGGGSSSCSAVLAVCGAAAAVVVVGLDRTEVVVGCADEVEVNATGCRDLASGISKRMSTDLDYVRFKMMSRSTC